MGGGAHTNRWPTCAVHPIRRREPHQRSKRSRLPRHRRLHRRSTVTHQGRHLPVGILRPRRPRRPFNWQAAMEHLHGPKAKPEHRAEPNDGDIGGLVGFLSTAQTGDGTPNSSGLPPGSREGFADRRATHHSHTDRASRTRSGPHHPIRTQDRDARMSADQYAPPFR